MNKKFIASWMIALFLVSFIPISGFNEIKNVNAAPVCCEKTSSGATCQYVEDSECASGSKAAPTNCYFTSYCKPGTCFDLNDGRCYANMPLATCTARGDSASFSDLPIESTPQCDVGCCIIGNQASLITQTRCKKETSKYPDLQMVFKEEIKDEGACVDLARSSEKGCCVQGSDSCSYTARANCPQTTGTSLGSTGFFPGRFCSSADLNCDCTPGKTTGKKGCLGGSDDVYYFDSCGNQEEIAEDCDYVDRQNTCGRDKTSGEYKCLDVSCSAEMEIFNLDGKTIYTKDSEVKNGESWCGYDVDMNKFSGKNSLIAFGRDVPGSRYYRGLCINNKVITEPCKDFREEWCISDAMDIEGANYNVAACRLNRWQDCLGKNKKDCENTELRDCLWTAKKCVPFVSPGGKFWEEENTDVCSQGSNECEVIFSVPGLTKMLGEDKGGQTGAGELIRGIDFLANLGGLLTFDPNQMGWGKGTASKPKCVANCDCLDHNYAISQNNMCRALGDCGAEFNLLTAEGKQYENIFSGFKITHGSEIPDIVKYADGVPGNGDPGTIGVAELKNWYTMEKPDSSAKEQDKITSGIKKVIGPLLGNAINKGIYARIFLKEAVTWKTWGKVWTKMLNPLAKKVATAGAEKAGKLAMLKGILLGKSATQAVSKLDEAALNAAKKAVEEAARKSIQQTAKAAGDAAQKAVQDAINKALSTAYTSAGKATYEATLRDLAIQQVDVPAHDALIKAAESITNLNKEASANFLRKEGSKLAQEAGEQVSTEVTSDAVTKAGAQAVGKAPTSALGFIMNIYNIISYIDMALSIIDMIGTDQVTVKIKSKCTSWQAPLNSKDCEKCNPDDINSPEWRADKTCSEYTCKSFGQSCVLLNAGTGNDTCVSQNPRDVRPPVISAWKDGLGNYKDKIIEVANRGYSYKEEIPAYTIFPMAISTNKPSQCRVSLNQSAAFENMDVFGSALYSYEHLVVGSLPVTYGIAANGSNIVPNPGTSYTLFIKCSDSIGNKNEAPYYIKYIIKEGPDVTPSVIEGTSIADNSYFTYGINETNIEIYTNEPSDCKWSNTNQEYNIMENTLQCQHTPNQFSLYTCKTTLKPLIDQIVNKFYFRCKDQPGVVETDRNTNEQSFELTLRGSYPLKIDSVQPSGDIYTRNFTMKVETSKGATYDGKSYCYYGNENDVNLMNLFFKTNSSYHEQVLSPVRSAAPYTYYVICVDYGGNFANATTTIKMSQDVKAPKITRVYKDSSYTPAHLKVILDEIADCQYKIGKDFTYGDGNPMATDSIEHDALYDEGATYYIRCLDASNNLMLHIFHA